MTPERMPDPREERARRQSREGYVQYLLACLVLGGRPRGWNKPDPPSDAGLALLQAIERHCFDSIWEGQVLFAWEHVLPGEETGDLWPDYAALWPDRTLLFELKTEPGSVRDGQVDAYVKRALRQTDHQVDFVYLTRDEVVGAPSGEPDRFRYATMTWLELLDVLADWADDAPDEEQQLAAFLDEFIRGELYEGRVVVSVDRPTPSMPFRAESTRHGCDQVAIEPEVPPGAAVEAAVRVAWEVEADGSGRGVNTRLTSRRAVEDLKAAAKEALRDAPPAHARPWIWCVDTSTGHALTTAGEETGFELRFEYVQRGTAY